MRRSQPRPRQAVGRIGGEHATSHSLHPFGTLENLKNDFCIYSRAAKGINRDHCGDKLRRTLTVYPANEVVNFGSSFLAVAVANMFVAR